MHQTDVAAAAMTVDDSEEDLRDQKAPYAKSRCDYQSSACITYYTCAVFAMWKGGSTCKGGNACGDAYHALCRRTQAVLDSEDGDGGKDGGSSSSDSQAVDQDSGSEFEGEASSSDDGDSSSENSDLDEEQDHEPTPKKAKKVCLQNLDLLYPVAGELGYALDTV